MDDHTIPLDARRPRSGERVIWPNGKGQKIDAGMDCTVVRNDGLCAVDGYACSWSRRYDAWDAYTRWYWPVRFVVKGLSEKETT